MSPPRLPIFRFAVNIGQKRYAVVSAIAATSVPALVLARGHKIEAVPEVGTGGERQQGKDGLCASFLSSSPLLSPQLQTGYPCPLAESLTSVW